MADNNPIAQSGDPAFPDKYDGSLVAQLTSYLALPAPSSLVRTAAVTICPASYRVLPKVAANAPLNVPICYFSQASVTNEPGPPADYVLYPLGRPDDTLPVAVRSPKKVTTIRHPSDSWLMTDCDLQLLTGLGISSATYMDYIAKQPVHGSIRPALRNYLFYDISVRGRKSGF